jgi:hypothetical protein
MCAGGRRNSLGTVRRQRVGALDAPLSPDFHLGLPGLLLLAPQRQIPVRRAAASRTAPRPGSPEAPNGAPPVRHCVCARSEARERRAQEYEALASGQREREHRQFECPHLASFVRLQRFERCVRLL